MDIKTDMPMEQQILETAERLFLEKGFDATSTTQIAKAVGCNQALVHYYFRTKDNLFNRIFESKFKAFFQNIFETNKLAGLSFSEKIKHIAETHFDLIAENPMLPRLILNELSRRPEHVKEIKEKLKTLPEQLFEIMNKELQEEIKVGKIKAVTLMDVVLTTVSLNVALFVMLPIAKEALKLTSDQIKFILAHRKTENVNIIMSYLRP